MSGVNGLCYWLGNYAWDLLNAVVVVFIVFIAFVAFQTDGYKGEGLNAIFQVMVSGSEHIIGTVVNFLTQCAYMCVCACARVRVRACVRVCARANTSAFCLLQ